MGFVHLHNYTEYTVDAGSMKIDAMVQRAKELGMSALAITDAGRLSGAIEFYQRCRAADIKPILGIEAGVSGLGGGSCADSATAVLLAMNQAGWQNLCRISSRACSRVADTNEAPAVTLSQLKDFSGGLVCLLSGMSGSLARACRDHRPDQAKDMVRELNGIFGDGRLYLARQDHRLSEELTILPDLVTVASAAGIPLVATNHCRFARPADAESYRIIRSIRSKGSHSKAEPSHEQFYMKSAHEMAERFADLPHALARTVEIAERCNVEIDTSTIMPPVTIPAEFETANDYLKHLAEAGLAGRYDHITAEHRDRLAHELRIVGEHKVAEYWLFVHDYVRAAQRLGFLVSERGSVSGSLVAFALGITTTDPLEYGLIFERFHNPQRWHMPDIDLDIEDEGRLQVIDYLAERYGKGHVAHVGSFYRFTEERAVRSVAEHLGYSAPEIQTQVYHFQDDPDREPVDERERLLLKAARLLSGLVSHYGTHPCGIVVTPTPIEDCTPVCVADHARYAITQLDGRSVEDAGLIKFDLIGSKTLALLHTAVKMIEERSGVLLDLQDLPQDDARTYDLLQKGLTAGVFQFGSRGIRECLREVRPDSIEDLTALLALYRPAPMEHIETYASRKHGIEPIEYPHSALESILSVTYGLLVYQEQILRIGAEIGGLSLADADIMRRAIYRRQAEPVADFKERFLAGAVATGLDAGAAAEVFRFLEQFGTCTFNHSHAISYARVSYQAAFLKANYPLEFLAAFLNTYADDRHAIDGVLEDAAETGIPVDPPDINAGDAECTIQNDRVRLGLSSVRRCSTTTAQALVDARAKDGPFRDLFGVPRRLSPETLNRGDLLALISSGALSALPGSLAQQFAAADAALKQRHAGAADAPPPQLPQDIDSFDLLKEIASIHRYAARDLSFDVYCPKRYSHHLRFTIWLPAESVIFDLEMAQLMDHARLFAAYFETERNGEYAIGLNSRINQYAEKHLLMLDLDSVDDAAIDSLRGYGGYLLRSGRGYHFIGKSVIADSAQWHTTLRALQKTPELRKHIDSNHIEMSLKRGYSTLRILESPAKPQRPMMIRML